MSVGMQAYVRELVARLPGAAPDLQFLVLGNASLASTSPNASVELVSEAMACNGSFGEQVMFPRLLAASRADLVHYMSVYAPRLSPLPHVYTIHDVIHLRFPRYFSWKVPPYYRLVVGPTARSARTVITDAQATIADLHDLLGVKSERVRVIPLGVSEAFELDKASRSARAALAVGRFGLERPYFIYAGNHRPHKNLETLVAAWQRTGPPCDLVLTEEGPFGFALDRGEKANGKIHLTGHISLDDLISLYAGCCAAVQPSLYEGFGLSVLEAMACGAPVIVAQTPVLLEIGADAVVSFPQTEAPALAEVMTTLLLDPAAREGLSEAGSRRVLAFTWDKTARATADVYREALA
jgi:glycosyltransferase involved in cell wall biosynthesis